MNRSPSLHEEAPHLSRHTRWRGRALTIGLCAFGGCLLTLWLDPQPMLAAYLVAWFYFLGLSLGALAALMVHHLTGGDWGRPVRRYFEAMLAPLPLLAVLFAPLALNSSKLFVGAPDQGYLTPGFLILRATLYFVLWALFAYLLTRAGRDQKRAIAVSAAGLIVYGVTGTLAATDWIAALTPGWSSTNLGLIVITSQGLGAMALAVAAAAGLTLALRPADTSMEAWQVTPSRGNDLGNLLLTFVMTWMYLTFMQLLIIWAEDLPRETAWYRPRLEGAGQYFTLVVMLTQFAIPFAILLFRRIKRDARALFAVACGLLLAHVLEVTWLILPSARPADGVVGSAGRVILASVAIGGLWLFFVARDLARRPTLAHAALDARDEVPTSQASSHG